MTGFSQGYDPRTGTPVGTGVTHSAPATIEAALQATHEARRVLADSTVAERTAWLAAISAALTGAEEQLVGVADAETALGPTRLTGELGRARSQLDLFAAVLADGRYLDIVVDTPDSLPPGGPQVTLTRMLHPVGPVAVWAASNFPFAFGVIGTDTVSALAAGCPVLVKSHESQPATSAAIGEVVTAALRAAGAPEGTFAVLHGRDAGDALIEDPRIEAGAFTGSLQGGRALFDRACARPRPIPFYGELGSLNPAFVTPAATAARGQAIADGFVASMTLGTGQFCTKPGVLFVQRDSTVLQHITTRIRAAGAGPLLNERIHDEYTRSSQQLQCVADGGVGWWAGQAGPGGAVGEGYWATPTILAVAVDTFHQRFDELAQECFGPFSLVVEYDNADEMLGLAARFTGSLTGTIHAEPGDEELAAELIAVLRERVGRIVWNGWPTGVAVGWAMHHGGPYPASTTAATTSVGARAIGRFLRPVAYQDVPPYLLPQQLHTPVACRETTHS